MAEVAEFAGGGPGENFAMREERAMPMRRDAMPRAKGMGERARIMPVPMRRPGPLIKPEDHTTPVDPAEVATDPNLGDMDFMKNIKKNVRAYQHLNRRGYDKLDRVDFAQTVVFESARELKSNNNGAYTYNTSFNLNDQVSSFQIEVNVFSTGGKYSFAKKQLVSSRAVYS